MKSFVYDKTKYKFYDNDKYFVICEMFKDEQPVRTINGAEQQEIRRKVKAVCDSRCDGHSCFRCSLKEVATAMGYTNCSSMLHFAEILSGYTFDELVNRIRAMEPHMSKSLKKAFSATGIPMEDTQYILERKE